MVTTQAREDGGTWHLPPEPSTLTTEEMMYHQGWGRTSEKEPSVAQVLGGMRETHRGSYGLSRVGRSSSEGDRRRPVTRLREAGGHQLASHGPSAPHPKVSARGSVLAARRTVETTDRAGPGAERPRGAEVGIGRESPEEA